MTVYDLIKKFSDKTEEEQKHVVVASLWYLKDVDAIMEEECVSGLTDDEKMDCLAEAVASFPYDEDIIDCLRGLVREKADAKAEE